MADSRPLLLPRHPFGNVCDVLLTAMLVLFFAIFVAVVDAKHVTGDFKLSGANSEYKVTTFAIRPEGGRLTMNLESKDLHANEMHMKLRLYRDREWAQYKKALTCHDKIKLAQQTNPIEFEYNEAESKWVANVLILMFNDKLDKEAEGKKFERSHYWYFVIDDCTLEEYYQDDKTPRVHYTVDVTNHLPRSRRVTHLSADEWNLFESHFFTMLISGLVAAFLGFKIVRTILFASSSSTTAAPGTSRRRPSGTSGSVHASVLWVSVAAAFDSASSFFEMVHIAMYKRNGYGSYISDALSSHFEAVCDALLVLLLVSIASGWTLPSDVIAVNPGATNSVQRLLQNLSQPLVNLHRINAVTVLALAVIGSHLILAQWGRTYNDDFESYHDYSHLPGKILMLTRIVAGMLFLIATNQTRTKCQTRQLRIFYKKLMVFGAVWFYSLPVLTWVVNHFVPYYLRNHTVFVGSSFIQCTCIVSVAWLVTSHSSSYHKYSHISSEVEKSLTDSLSHIDPVLSEAKSGPAEHLDGPSAAFHSESPRTWTLGKAKVRLD